MFRALPLWAAAFILPLAAGCETATDVGGSDSSNFGRFEGNIVAVWDDNGRHMTLQEPFSYIDPSDRKWTAPAGTTVDGASIPSAFWTFIGGPFEGKYRKASVVHDIGCIQMTQSWEDVHRMFYEACRCAGVEESEAKMLYYAVYHFGPRWEPVTETVVETQQLANGEVVEREVQVQHMVRVDPLPPTPEELQQVESYVAEENPEPEAIKTFNRDSLHKRWRGRGGSGRVSSDSGERNWRRQSEGIDSQRREWSNPSRDHFANSNAENPQVYDRERDPLNANPHGIGDPRSGHGHVGYSGNHGYHPPGQNQVGYTANGFQPQQGYSQQGFGQQGNSYRGHQGNWQRPPLTPEEQQWATDLVRQYIEEQAGEPRPANYEVQRGRGGFRVSVQFLHQDEQGQLVPTEGGTSTVRLTREGKIVEFVSGNPSQVPTEF